MKQNFQNVHLSRNCFNASRLNISLRPQTVKLFESGDSGRRFRHKVKTLKLYEA
jgi:hypothetical protein